MPTMSYARTIALDGPAASGKTTIGTRLAERLRYAFVDSGVLYRAVTLVALNLQLDRHDAAWMARVAQTLQVELMRQNAADADAQPGSLLHINGEPPGVSLYTPAVDSAVPVVAAHGAVRQVVRRIQHGLAAQGAVILAGRDIGTVVLPDADLKIYLEPSLDVRARRRWYTLPPERTEADYERLRAALWQRDLADMSRHESPLHVARDAIVINTDDLRPNQVVALIMQYAERG